MRPFHYPLFTQFSSLSLFHLPFIHAVATGLGQIPALDRLAPLSGAVQVLNVPNDENSHGKCHENGIKNVQVDFMRNEMAVVALQILDNAENAPHKDDGARDVEYDQITSPRYLSSAGDSSGVLDQSDVEKNGGDDEEAKDEDLNEETGNDDLLAHFVHLQSSSGLDSAASSLESKGDHIASNEKSRYPVDRNQREMLALDRPDEATEYHIYRGGIECWCNEDENGLHDEPAEGELVEVTPYSPSVTDGLDCIREPLAFAD